MNCVLTLIPSEFTHLTEKSRYNHNYYLHSKHGYVILEKAQDDGPTHYYLIENEVEIFLGGTLNDFNISEVWIDFRFYHT